MGADLVFDNRSDSSTSTSHPLMPVAEFKI